MTSSAALEAEFYDRDILDGGAATLAYEDSPWKTLYDQAAKLVAANEPVVDLGCGTGRFLAALYAAAPWRYADYLGVDFSEAAIAEAQTQRLKIERNGERTEADADQVARFEVADLRRWRVRDVIDGNVVFVTLETLEHLDDDLDTVSNVPPGHRLILSIPNHPSDAHVRWFPTAASVWARYDGLLEFRSWRLVEFDERHAAHLVETIRRADSW